MSGTNADAPVPGAPALCLGDPLVELICERPLEDLAEADAFVPHFGGGVANVAVTAARHGAPVALAGGAGDDAWGRWLRDRLGREGVEVSRFELVPRPTPLALVAVDRAGVATSQVYGESLAGAIDGLGDTVEDVVRAAAALLVSSCTMEESPEREVTLRLREAALALGRPIVLFPSLRVHRWRSRAEAAASLNACVPGAFLVQVNADEAELMTGEDDPERAALALLKAGARMVVISLGADGAMLRGELRADAPGRAATVLSTIGAGDVLTGVLLARLTTSRFYPPAVAAALPEAVAQSALACERWGALD